MLLGLSVKRLAAKDRLRNDLDCAWWDVKKPTPTPSAQATDLHDCNGSVRDRRPVDRTNEYTASDERTQLGDNSIRHVHHIDQRTYSHDDTVVY